VRLNVFKKWHKSTLAFNVGWKLRKSINFCRKLSFILSSLHLSFFFGTTIEKYKREIREVRKTQQENPEFGHKPGEMKHSIEGESQKIINFVVKLSLMLSFSLKPCALKC